MLSWWSFIEHYIAIFSLSYFIQVQGSRSIDFISIVLIPFLILGYLVILKTQIVLIFAFLVGAQYWTLF